LRGHVDCQLKDGLSSPKLADAFESDDRAVEQVSIDVAGVGRYQVASALAAAMARHDRPAVLTAATDREAIERTVGEGEARDLGPDERRDRIASGLAATAAAVVESRSPSGLFYTGSGRSPASVPLTRQQSL
jgi:hypothetical protein